MECELVAVDDDDDLVIIGERPAPPPDLVMDCDDEPLDIVQRNKHEEDAAAFQQTLKLVKSWSIKNRLQTQRRNSIVMGSSSIPLPAGVTSLTRPPQPKNAVLRASQNFISARPGSSVFGMQQNRPPISVVRQQGVSPRGKLQIRPSATSRPNDTQTASVTANGLGAPTRASAAASAVPTSQQLTLANGQVVNVQNFQPLLFDSTSGLLLMPNAAGTTTQVQESSGSTGTGHAVGTNITASRSITIQSTSGTQIRSRGHTANQNRPISTNSSASTSSFTPKIISSSSLTVRPSVNSGGTPARYPAASANLRPVSNTAVRPRVGAPAPLRAVNSGLTRPVSPAVPSRISPAILNRPTLATGSRTTATSVSINRSPTPTITRAQPPQNLSKPSTQYPTKPRPAMPSGRAAPASAPQIETTNTINGPQAEKDSNNNKTFPSLVVVIKPCLGDKITRQVLNAARAELDARVKALLLHSPAKLTEWLMQQGLLRLEHRCLLHMTADRENIKYKLGMYSDGGKQPFSGGYVWITECCPDAQISVFHGSIFESAVYTPGTIMKLIYHWACQTSSQNVLQWVKVSSYYLKNFYTLLRSCCVAALHEYAPMMGGQDKFVEVGIITLGTPLNQVQPNHKPIKIEIVGVFDPAGKIVRMKVINPLGGANASTTQSRLQQILWPLKNWVDKESTILIDNSIDKHSLAEMGFKSVIQSKIIPSVGSGIQQTNANVMNYLKHIIPKMFQNTLSVLSKSLIQQFLDELSWRELWGSTSAAAFDTMIHHLVQMTKWELDETLISRLNKISLNPFAEWSYSKALTPTGIDMLPDSIRSAGSGMPTLESYAAYVQASNGYSGSGPNSPSTTDTSHANVTGKRKGDDAMNRDDLRQYLSSRINDNKVCINLFGYYYAEAKPVSERTTVAPFPTNLKCPLCYKGFLTNQEIVRHIASHVNSVGRASAQVVYCEFCLKEIGNHSLYATHLSEVHKQEHVSFPCYICLESFPNKTTLILHMWQTHEKLEMPYKCECCNYKNSRHHEVVEHFHREHGGSDQVLCPICLKVFTIRGAADIQCIVVHLQSHSGKKGKKCGQCILNFVGEFDIRSHAFCGAHSSSNTAKTHSSLRSLQSKEILMPVPPKFTKTKYFPPSSKKAKLSHQTSSRPKTKEKPSHLAHLEKGTLSIESMKFFTHAGEDPNEVYNCLECKSDVLTPYHYPGCLTCAKCTFSTSCAKSMWAHNRNNHQVGRAAKGVGSMYTNLTSNVPIKCECGARPENFKDIIAHITHCGNRTGTLLRKGEEGTESDDENNSVKGNEDMKS